MNFEDYNKLSASKKRQYIEFTNAKKNISESVKNSTEAEQLEKPFYKKSNFWIMLISALIPTILGALAFYGTNAREFFNNKVTEVKLEKRELKLQIDSLNKIKNTIREKITNDSLRIDKYYNDKLEKIKLIQEKKEESYQKEKGELLIDQNKLNVKLNVKNRSIEDCTKDLTEALQELKVKNEIIFEQKQKVNEIKSIISEFNENNIMKDEDIRSKKYTILMKNIFLYMLYNKKTSVSIKELQENVSKSIKVNHLFFIIDESDGTWRFLGLSKDEDTGDDVLIMKKNVTSDYLIDFYCTSLSRIF